MKIRAIILFVCFFSSISCKNLKPFVIGGRGGGFFSNFLGVLNNISWAESHNRCPIVYWGKAVRCYHDRNIKYTNNVWNYYFEPLVTYKYSIKHVWDKYENPSGSYIAYKPPKLSSFTKRVRNKYHTVIQKHVRLKPHVQEKIDRFYEENFKGIRTIGIHLRGTDKKGEVKPVNCMRIFNAANKLAKKIGECQFFVATDEDKFVQKAKNVLKGKVVLYDAYRSTNGQPIHKNKKKPALYQLGEEVLVETYLLSRCDYFLHTCSNISIAACMINPTLVNYLFV